MRVREVSGSPAMLPLYAKAAAPALPVLARMPGVRRSGGALPELELVLPGAVIDAERLAAYCEVCGFGAVRRTLPATYPHVLAFPLHLALMTDGSFPFAPIGLVHLENRITQHRPLGVDEALELRVWPAQLRAHARGRQFDIVTEARVDGELVWSEVSTFLRSGRSGVGAVAASALSGLEAPAGATRWKLGADLGRRYASVSADRNPIHLYGVTAKVFGFQRPIAHGMWSMARCLAALEPRLPAAFEIAGAFKKPVLLPSSVSFGARFDGEIWAFGLRDAKKDLLHVAGEVRPR